MFFTLLMSFLKLSSAAPLALTQQDVADLILKQSYRAQEINLSAQANKMALATVEHAYDFSFSAETGFTSSKYESLSNTYLVKDEYSTTTAELVKPFSTGTTAGLYYSHVTDQPRNSDTAPTQLADSTKDIIGISLSQNLLKNFFGVADRAVLRAAEQTYQASQIDRFSQLQDLVLDALRAYWSTYVAQETYQEAVSSRDRYAKLIGSIKKKSGYGNASPGELSQAQAELEEREQRVKSSMVDYLQAMDQFITLLKLPKGSEIKFSVPLEAPAPPAVSSVDVENLRPMKVAALSYKASEDALSAASSHAYPAVNLVGKLYQQGLDPSSSEANSEMMSGTHPQYYLGVQLQHSFGSGYSGENQTNKKLLRDLSKSKLERSRLELLDQENHYLRKIQSTYAISQSSKIQKSLREKASQELTRTYNQGRTDISILIDALNKYFDSEVQYTRAIGDYQIALNEWAAFKDQLIPDEKAKP